MNRSTVSGFPRLAALIHRTGRSVIRHRMVYHHFPVGRNDVPVYNLLSVPAFQVICVVVVPDKRPESSAHPAIQDVREIDDHRFIGVYVDHLEVVLVICRGSRQRRR